MTTDSGLSGWGGVLGLSSALGLLDSGEIQTTDQYGTSGLSGCAWIIGPIVCGGFRYRFSQTMPRWWLMSFTRWEQMGCVSGSGSSKHSPVGKELHSGPLRRTHSKSGKLSGRLSKLADIRPKGVVPSSGHVSSDIFIVEMLRYVDVGMSALMQ